MKRSISSAGLISLVLALVCFTAAAALFHGDIVRGQGSLFIADAGSAASR